jgi:hypothetical protein
MNKNEAIIQSIIVLLKAFLPLHSQINIDKAALNSLRYLLGQSVRQYDIPLENYHISQAALERWEQLSKDKIEKYHYRDMVKCDNLTKLYRFKQFKGASKSGNPRKLHPNGSFVFRDMFHEDHVIPVSLILNELIKIKTVDENSVKEQLNKMHICIILKEEDRKLGRTISRTANFVDTINNVYKPKGIMSKYFFSID